MHAAGKLWSGFDLSHVSKPRFSPIETGLCRILNPDFRDPSKHSEERGKKGAGTLAHQPLRRMAAKGRSPYG
jgi:hypothetical protein